MDAPFLVRGDPLPDIDPLAESPEGEHARGLFWGIDLSRCRTRKHARAVWHDALDNVKAELDQHPELRRVCLACSRPRQFPQNALVRVPEGLALRLHNDFERDRARYLSVLVLDVTGCDNSMVLGARLCEALAEPVSWSDLTLSWDSVAESCVVDAWASRNL